MAPRQTADWCPLMGRFLDPLIVEVTGRERDGQGWFILKDRFRYQRSNGEVVEVAAEFGTDFSTTPRLARMFLPQTGRSAAAAVLHDWLLNQNDERANDVFSEALRDSGVNGFRHWICVTFVRAWTV